MSIWSILETLLIGPLKLIFEIIFEYANRFVNHPGLAIIFLSLIMNILVLPLYRRADAMQEAIRDIEARLHDGVTHIKKTFSGDERMMILQTYYRQNHYKPTDALNGSISLLLEIPFFIAAYQFLSHLEILQGVSFGPIKDLGAPDGLLTLGGITINLLPILMTLINFISSALYLKGFPLKTKIQLYAMAIFFLVFLYSSPSCLLFYWTLNNLFSLVKNVFYKLKNPQKVLRYFTACLGLLLTIFGIFFYHTSFIKRRCVVIGLGLLLIFPLILHHLKSMFQLPQVDFKATPNRRLFLLGSVFLTILVGMFIPSVFIAASPQEYVNITYFQNPLWYIVRSVCYAAGTFLIWMRVFYSLASTKGKVIFDRLVWILCGVMLVNYMFFGTNLGILSASLQYENGMSFSAQQILFNLAVLFIVSILMYLFAKKWRRIVPAALIVLILALGGMSVRNIAIIKESIDQISLEESGTPHFQLSKTGKNVVVIMLDRSLGELVPFIFNEKPELKESFAGFTYYENTISFGAQTNFGSPALLGGYEYTPVEMNKRSTESLASKHNEALKVMPVLFLENGYDVTVCDPVYANYQWVPDLNIYSDYPEIHTYITDGKFGDAEQTASNIQSIHRNFFCFSIMKSMPLLFQPSIYDNGSYHQIKSVKAEALTSPQALDGWSIASGVSEAFVNAFPVLQNLTNMTQIEKHGKDSFLLLTNIATHEPMLLQTPDYLPAQTVDNTEYDAKHPRLASYNGKEYMLTTEFQMVHYHVNMAAFLQLANWFDYLRENNVYDNTRIILVADHGYPINLIPEMIFDNADIPYGLQDLGSFFPLLMVKDFDSTDFNTSNEFMTNADVPVLALKDLIQDPKNPFTGKSINSSEKNAHDQFVIVSGDWQTDINNGNTFLPAQWYRVSNNNLWNKDNWTFYNQMTVLDKYDMP